MEYYIYLTNDCNLHCAYCSALFDCEKKGIPLTPQYSPQTLLAFVNDTQRSRNDEMAVLIFFGGEPTLEYGQIDVYMNIFDAQQAPYAVKYVLHTNGLLLGEMPESVGSRLDMVILSINYDKIPRNRLGSGYFSVIMDNVRALRRYEGLALMARLTISESGSLYTETLLCEHFFDYVYWQIVNCKAFDDFDAFYKSYTYETELGFSYWLAELERGRLLFYIPFVTVMREMLSPLSIAEAQVFGCSYDSSQLYLQTDGSIYSCCDNIADDIPAVGSIEHGYTFRHPSWTEYARCRGCEYNFICRGRCGRMHSEFDEAHIDEYCALNRFMFDLFHRNRDRIFAAADRFPDIMRRTRDWHIDITELTP